MELPVIVVSGLPRSGTSMMMKMLEAGGLELVVDHKRRADEDNPKGYFEYEKVKKIKDDASWLDDIGEKVVKIISLLLYHLPQTHRYKILFMERQIQEVLDSQRKMLERSRQQTQTIDDSILAEKFEVHLKKVSAWIQRQPNVESLYVGYREAIQDPLSTSLQVRDFLGKDLDINAMTQAIDGSLYRNRHRDLKK